MTSLPKIIAYCRSLKLRNPTANPTPGSVMDGTEHFGAQLAEGFQSVQDELTAIKQQGNFSGSSQPAAPPPIDRFTMSNGPSGEIQFSIQHSGQISRGINYSVELDTSPHFSNPHTYELGQSRNGHVNLPGQTFYGRASAWYSAGVPTPYAYHGSSVSPAAITGGVIGPRSASQGSSTGAPGTGGQGPVPARTPTCGYNWNAQQARETPGASSVGTTPAGTGATAGSGGSGSGGGGSPAVSESIIAASETLTSIAGTGNAITGVTATPYSARVIGFVLRYIPIHANSGATTINENSIGAVAVTDNGGNALVGGEFVVGKASFLMWDGTEYQIVGVLAPISATVLASDAHGVPSVAALPDTHIWIGSGGNLPADKAISGDATLADTGALTLATVNASPGTYGDATHVAQVTVNGKGLAPTISSVAITFPATSGYSGTVTLAALTALGAQGSITFVNGLATSAVNPT